MNTEEDNQTVEPVIVPAPVAAEVAEPVVTPIEATALDPKEENTPGVIILQWLSYAFWGWLIVVLIWLLSIILVNLILKDPVSGAIPYAIAAAIVLLPIAFLTDFFYRKHEPLKKTGIAMVIMVIHAVLFALLAISALIVTVFNSLNILVDVSQGAASALTIILLSAAASTVLYTAAFLRTLNPFKSKKPVLIYGFAMAGVTILLIALAIAGPFVRAFSTVNDRRIEQNLSSVSQGINSYIEENKQLPSNLGDIEYTNDDAKSLIEDGLVTFKADKSVTNINAPLETEYRYQLCVTYKEESNSRYSQSTPRIGSTYSSYLSISGHPKGEVCYKLGTSTETTNVLEPQNDGGGLKVEPITLN